MKTVLRSSSFLFIVSSLLVVLAVTKAIAQKPQDSLEYYKRLAVRPQNAADFLKATVFFDNSFKANLKKKDTLSAIKSLYYTASLQYKRGAYNDSETTAVHALSLLDNILKPDHTNQVRQSFNNLLGMIYDEQNNEVKAVELYTKVLAIVTDASDSAMVYNNLAQVYKNQNKFLKAQTFLLQAEALLPKVKEPLRRAKIIDNLGLINSYIDASDGLDLMTAALNIRVAIKDTFAIYTSYGNLARYYARNRDTTRSKAFALKAYAIANRLNSPTYRRHALEALTDLSTDDYTLEYKRLNDSLYKAEKVNMNSFALLKYDVTEGKRKIIESKLQEAHQRRLKMRFLFGGIILFLIGALLYLLRVFEHNKETLQAVYQTESDISKKLHDEVANDLFHIMTKLEQEECEEHEDLIHELEHLYIKTRDISKEHSALDNNYPFKDHLQSLVESFQDSKTNVIVKGLSDISWGTMSAIETTTVYKSLQELLINMKKHSAASLVIFIFEYQKRKLHISYSDNGVGSDLKPGHGLHNTESRIKAINGSVIFVSHPKKGFKAEITI